MANKWKAGNYMGSGKSKSQYLGTQSGGGVAPTDAYSALMSKMENSAKPSKAEKNISKQLTGMETQKGKSLNDALGRPVMQGFVTGQQAAIEDRYSKLTQPLTAKLSNLMQQRGAYSDVLNKEAGIVQQRQAQANADRAAAMDQQQLGISSMNAQTSRMGVEGKSNIAPTVKNMGTTKKPVYMQWDGTKWVPVSGGQSTTTNLP